MSVKSISYIEAAKKKPGLLIHLGLFVTMCVLNDGVWESVAEVLPESAKLGHRMIIAESITVLIIIAMAVRGSRDVVRRALQLLVAVTAVTVFNFGVHWFYSRDTAMANKFVAYQNKQGVVDSQRATEQAGRVKEVFGAMTEFNKSQEKLSNADAKYYATTGQRRERKTQSAPNFEQLGIIVPPSPTPTPQPVLANGLVMPNGTPAAEVKIVEVKPLTPDQVSVKYSPWFLFGGLLALAVTFVGGAAVAAKWEWDWNGNELADKFEGKA